MKKTFSLLLFSAFFFSAQSQLTKGNWLLGGTGTLYTYSHDYALPSSSIQYKYVDIGISASVGYFFADKIAAGLRPSFSLHKGHWTGSTGGVGGGSTNTKRYAIGPFARYYFLNTEKPFNIVGDACYQFGKVDFTGESGKMNEFSIMTGPVIFFNSSIGIEVLLGYVYKFEEIKNNYRDERKGFQVGVGFQIHLEK